MVTGDVSLGGITAVATVDELAGLLRQLRRRAARAHGDRQLSYRELAAKTGWAHGVIGDYFSGRTLPPTDRFDVLVRILGASAEETGMLATARDRVEEGRRAPRPGLPAAPVPRELPRPVSGFVGRSDQLAALDALLDAGDGPAPPVVISAVSGTAGVGKTALAVHWATRVAGRFPDGCLYLNLHGYGPTEPLRPQDALTGFLRSLGIPSADLPLDVGGLSSRFRTAVADRRMLILLDNAHSAEQVRPLLPGTLSCCVVVTSRDQMAGLVARDGARRLDVDRLPAADAVTLLGGLIGQRAAAEPESVVVLADRCARLPLALRIAAELAAARPSASLAELVGELGAGPRILDLLDAGGDADTAVRPIFSWSYRHLSTRAARGFRLLGAFPRTDFTVSTLAALAGADDARRIVGELARAHLVERVGADRYGLHDLLRAYAAEQLAEEEPGGARSAAERVRDHFLTTAAIAVESVYPAAPDATRRLPEGDAVAWLDAELAAMIALSDQAVTEGGSTFPMTLSTTLWRYLDRGSRYSDALVVHGNAVTAARAHGDRGQEAAALGELGQIHTRLGRYEVALDHLRRALDISRSTGDRGREATALNRLAIVCSRLGRSSEAVGHYRQALVIDREIGDLASAGRVLSNLGAEYADQGRFAEAVDHFEQALHLARDLGDRYGEGNAHNNIGLVRSLLGHYEDALRHYGLGLTAARRIGDRAGEGRVLANLGVVLTRLGDHRKAGEKITAALRIHRDMGDRAAQAEALTYLAELAHETGEHGAALDRYAQALAIARDIGFRAGVCRALNGTGRALLALGRAEDAAGRHRQANDLAADIGDRLQAARAHEGLSDCARVLGDPGRADEHRAQAAATYAEIGVPHTARV
ncbi:ATP-binding protein [Actinokineospora sp.]|uniref:ATP-binding protein n=1 Tax=Actinokineospora sp. TaxID=1872133 RepID=UPI004037AE36